MSQLNHVNSWVESTDNSQFKWQKIRHFSHTFFLKTILLLFPFVANGFTIAWYLCLAGFILALFLMGPTYWLPTADLSLPGGFQSCPLPLLWFSNESSFSIGLLKQEWHIGLPSLSFRQTAAFFVSHDIQQGLDPKGILKDLIHKKNKETNDSSNNWDGRKCVKITHWNKYSAKR